MHHYATVVSGVIILYVALCFYSDLKVCYSEKLITDTKVSFISISRQHKRQPVVLSLSAALDCLC